MKNGKAAGFDEVSPDVLKADPATTADILERLLRRIWELENLPEDWRKGLIIKLQNVETRFVIHGGKSVGKKHHQEDER